MAMAGLQLHIFDSITIETEQQPNGEYTAIDYENYEGGGPMGWGHSRLEAIGDLREKLGERVSGAYRLRPSLQLRAELGSWRRSGRRSGRWRGRGGRSVGKSDSRGGPRQLY